MKGRITNLVRGLDGKQQLTVTLDGDARKVYDDLHDYDVDVTVKRWRPKRSLNANAYFHVLVNQIAAKLNMSDTECKRGLVLEYGTVDRDEDGKVVGAKLPASVDATKYIEYPKFYATQYEGDREYSCYLFYKPTHLLTSAEMARLIDGTVQEAKQLDIETLPPKELTAMMAAWEEKQA